MYLSDLSTGALKTPATLHIFKYFLSNDSILWRELREWRK
jgi:hypothetical protein